MNKANYKIKQDLISAVSSGASCGPGAATFVWVSLLVATTIVVRFAALVAWHPIPGHGAVANVAGLVELSARRLRFHHHFVIQAVHGVGDQALAGPQAKECVISGWICPRGHRHH